MCGEDGGVEEDPVSERELEFDIQYDKCKSKSR
jgi:hypothetical protein